MNIWIMWLRYKLAWARNTQYIFQDFRDKFSFCPCGFFCKACLMMEIRDRGALKGIFYHIVYHSFFGKIYFWWKFKQPIEGVAASEVFEMLLDQKAEVLPMKIYREFVPEQDCPCEDASKDACEECQGFRDPYDR